MDACVRRGQVPMHPLRVGGHFKQRAMSEPTIDRSCRKCGKPERPLPVRYVSDPLSGIKFTVTGYLCSCGHWNNLKRRKAKKAHPEP